MKSSNFISESVYKTNLNYVRLQNKTKELFFRCLNEGRSEDYFKAHLKKIWGDIDYSYLEDSINEYEVLMHEINTGEKVEAKELDIKKYLPLVALATIMKTDKHFQDIKIKEYVVCLESYGYKTAKDIYLSKVQDRYTNQSVPYFSKKDGKLVRYVQPSTYNAMLHNTDLTRTGWNTTLTDGDELEQDLYYIPSHNFSCPYCMDHQNKVMTKKEVLDYIGNVEEGETDILHPNCKCVLAFYNNQKLKKITNKAELEEQYHIRQKVNTLTLRKEEIASDMKIAKMLGDEEKFDKYNQLRNKVNSDIRELKEALPTAELKKQVVAINR